jgi:hypothetical protein
LTREHVYGDWLSLIGLDCSPVAHGAGPLNRIMRDIGVTPPFGRTVRDVCERCNGGWMSDLEVVAGRVLTPFILGSSGTIEAADQGAVAAWVQKTALVAMLVSSESNRASGYGLPPSEYQALYEQRASKTPLPSTQMWIGKYDGAERVASTWVTPLVVQIEGLPELEHPQAYAVTIVLGQLLVHGVQFTSPSLQVELSSPTGMQQIWPPTDQIRWPSGGSVGEATLLRINGGKELRTTEPQIAVRPWTVATDLAESRAVGSTVEMDAICGEHVVYYPGALVEDAMRGAFYVFMTSCACDMAYIIETEPDGAHCKWSGRMEAISKHYDALVGEEVEVEDENGVFFCKRLNSS